MFLQLKRFARRVPRPETQLESFSTQMNERMDAQDEVLHSISEQTQKTNGRVNRIETQRDTAMAALLWAAGGMAFAITSGLALWAVLK